MAVVSCLQNLAAVITMKQTCQPLLQCLLASARACRVRQTHQASPGQRAGLVAVQEASNMKTMGSSIPCYTMQCLTPPALWVAEALHMLAGVNSSRMPGRFLGGHPLCSLFSGSHTAGWTPLRSVCLSCPGCGGKRGLRQSTPWAPPACLDHGRIRHSRRWRRACKRHRLNSTASREEWTSMQCRAWPLI